jgi:hypothetical protein
LNAIALPLWRAGLVRAPSLLSLPSLSALQTLFAKAQPIEIGDEAKSNRGHSLYSHVRSQADWNYNTHATRTYTLCSAQWRTFNFAPFFLGCFWTRLSGPGSGCLWLVPCYIPARPGIGLMH